MSSPQVLLPTDFSRSTEPLSVPVKTSIPRSTSHSISQLFASYIALIYRRTHETEINVATSSTHVVSIAIDPNMTWIDWMNHVSTCKSIASTSSLGFTTDGNAIANTDVTVSITDDDIICFYQEKLWKKESMDEVRNVMR